ncbi:hypothetical protein CBR_g57068 [Chara braunii]|uniref:Reverse transcriptase/retrotransposon-derived protein RNase H-like domain-containing protein n=1 Tax=Chara braunii TaxID=69332 RepID=A0A388K840_CHABU|nr:hypothetical protein CBR_g57068 [Chara braunii]|eukprot:GBG66189.1 hypothetical protein CBR_g57068 [Chara braunii]
MRRSQRLAERGSKRTQPQQGPKSPRIPWKRRTTMAEAADANTQDSPKRPVTPPMPVQQADETQLAFLERLQLYTETAAAELRKWEQEEAARWQAAQCQLAEAEAARQRAAAEAAAAARLQQQQVEASQNQAACSHQQTTNDQLQTSVSTGLAQLSAVESTGSAVSECSPALAAQTKQLEERINHVVASLGDISKFVGTSTVSNQLQTLSDRVQQRTAAVVKEWKMPNFEIEKFDDYHKTDPLQWWMAFNGEADAHHVPPARRLDALYHQLIGGAQTFMTHMAVTLECTIATLHTKIPWEDFEKKWKTRFMVNNDKRHVYKIFRMFQGQQPSREWLMEWQRLVGTPELNLLFDSVRAEFFARSCEALTAALGSEFQYETFDEMISKARELIQGNRRAANEACQQPGYVERSKGQRTPYVAAIQQGSSEDHAAASTSSDEDVAAAIPPQRSRTRGGKHKEKTASADGARQSPWTKFGIAEDMFNRSPDEHLRSILERLHIAKYKGNRDKSEFAQQELEYLGHYVTPQGTRPLADKVQAIQDWSDLACAIDVRSFLGLASYYMRFVKSFQRIAAPLVRLQSPLVPFEFNDEARHAFHTLKTALVQAPVLSIYDPTLPTKVTTDASGCGIGAVFVQHDDTDWHPVEYFSQKAPPINSLDDVRKKKLLAFVTILSVGVTFSSGVGDSRGQRTTIR